jgi:hypothetical protein
MREALREPVDAGAQQPQRGPPVQKSVRASVSAPTSGCPSMSDPAQLPKVPARPSTGTSNARSSSSSTCGTASYSVCSKKKRLRRTSVLDLRAHAADLVGEPPQGERLAQVGFEPAALRATDARVVEPVEQSRDAQLVVEHRPPRRLGGMRREHELDGERAHRRGEVGAVGAQQVGGLGERLALAQPAAS